MYRNRLQFLVNLVAVCQLTFAEADGEIELLDCEPVVSNGILYITFPQVSTTKTIINDYDPGKETIISSTGLLPEEPSPPSRSASKPCAFHPIMTTGPAGGLYKPYKGMVPAALEALE